jgi:RNA polymerase sigma factor (sigma-70 family)
VSNHRKYTEDELINGCRKGNRIYQQALYAQFSKRMLAVCLRYAKSTAEAEDVLQEGFVKVFQHIHEFKKQAQLETWVTRIMVNTALNMNRKKLYLFPMVDVSETTLVNSAEDLGSLEFEQLLKMIQSLPHGCQLIFNMYAVEGYTHQEIAQLLGISEGTSKSQYARGRELLRNQLQQEASRLKYGDKG